MRHRRTGAQLIEEALLLSVALVALSLLVGLYGTSIYRFGAPSSIVCDSGNVVASSLSRNHLTISSGDSLTFLVPLYSCPGSSWSELISAAANSSAPIVAIINPSNGPGGNFSSTFASGVAALKAEGIAVWGYVDLAEGVAPVPLVESEINDYASWYGVSGVFLDDFPSSPFDGLANYAATIGSYAASLGLITMGNPGTGPDSSYYGTVDALNVYEGSAVMPPGALALEDGDLPPASLAASTQSVIITDSPVLPSQSYFDAMTSLGVRYIYVSDAGSYFALPSYLSEELQEIGAATAA